MYLVGQTLKLERNPIYAGSLNGARLQESERTISRVEPYHGRIGIQFEGSKVWYVAHENSEWITSKNRRYRDLEFIMEGNK